MRLSLSSALSILFTVTQFVACTPQPNARLIQDFNQNWHFYLADSLDTGTPVFSEASWTKLNLPHDWSIEGAFDQKHPAGAGGGALPGGIGWYRKTFVPAEASADKKTFIQFDGIYQNSTVWINGQLLGTRPNGYISFEYDLTPHLIYGQQNEILVKVANSPQPNSRWYSGSGIYRNVRMVTTSPVYIPQWGTYITTPEIGDSSARVAMTVSITNSLAEAKKIKLTTTILDNSDREVASQVTEADIPGAATQELSLEVTLPNPVRWTLENPAMYRAVSTVEHDGRSVDTYETSFGIRQFEFNKDKGFSLNGVPTKIKGVCLHHDLGSLGAAFNKRAMQRQLEIMQGMGVNAIRTSHNPPAPEVLELCDEMGLLVMDEMFDMWSIGKTEFDYSQYWEEWHARDLEDFIRRDRNHPSIVVWSIGNEIMEQYNHEDSIGGIIARELAAIVRGLDDTRPITTANNDTSPDNPLIKLGGLDLVGLNYHHEEYADFQQKFPGRTFIATETNSALATRGYYDMPSDSLRKWPIQWDLPFTEGNPDNTVSAYDHVSAPWGSTQEDTWRIIKKHDFMSGLFIWTGFDYLGEPTPYGWPSRSSYFGVVDLAGVPKDTYFMYKSEWSEDTVLHIFPHWNWAPGQEVDVWTYYSYADEVELFLNGRSLGTKSKEEDVFHVMWRVPFEAGRLRAVSRKGGKEIRTKTINTAGKAYQIRLEADRETIAADRTDLTFITARVLDEEGNVVPDAADLITFEVAGEGRLVGVDNGDPVSHLSLKGSVMRSFHGLCLAVVQSSASPGSIRIRATAEGLTEGLVEVNAVVQ